jgi:protein-S-isoprenylcysteine O-methyltransferase Ste14
MLNILIAITAYGFLHSLTASPAVKRLARGLLGSAYQRGYRLLYNSISVISFIPVLIVARLNAGSTLYQLGLPWTLVTTAIQLAGLLVLGLGLVQTGPFTFLGLRQLLGGEQRNDQQLVISGLYRWVRHPLYTGGLLFIWATPLMTTGILALNLGLSLYIVIGSVFEEARLVSEFGDRYRKYQQDVPRLFPMPWKRAQ